MLKLSAADKRILKLAIYTARASWEQAARNAEVIAKAPAGAWHTDPKIAVRTARSMNLRMTAIDKTAPKLGFK